MNRIQARGGAIGFKMQGAFRLVLANAKLQEEVRRAHPEWSRDRILKVCRNYDSGWIENVVTDYGRRYLHNNLWGSTTLTMFIHEATAVANVRRTSLQFTYASQSPAQTRTPDSVVLDLTTLLQTRTVQFPVPAVSRTINTVGLSSASATTATQRALHAILAYTKLTTTVIQDTSSTADLQYRVSWSLN